MKKFFITGTDTDCGKTSITRLFIQGFHKQNKRVLALKPIASGQNQQGCNEDAYILAKESLQWANNAGGTGETRPVIDSDLISAAKQINPICFKKPIAPSIAADLEACTLTVQTVWDACQPILKTPADIVLVEGVGGFSVPLNKRETGADLAKKFNFPVILVVGLRLGCLNHAILTYQAILQANLQIAGWVANHIDPAMERVAENVETLKAFLSAPYLGFVPFGAVEEGMSTPMNKTTQFLLLP